MDSTLHTTILSLIRGTALATPPERQQFLNRFILQYRSPLVSLLRRKGFAPETAEDLVQEFLLKKLFAPKDNLASKFLASRDKRPELRFRGYLVQALNNFVIDHRRRRPEMAQLDHWGEWEQASTEDQFAVDWANSLLDRAINAVREDCEATRQPEIWAVFEARVLVPLQRSTPPPSYEELAQRVGLTCPKQASNRLQTAIRKLQRTIRRLVAEYLPSGGDEQAVEEEIKDLRLVLAQGAHLSLRAVTPPPRSDGSSFLGQEAAELLAIEAGPDELWTANDLAAMWSDLIECPLESVLAPRHSHLALKYADLHVLDGHPFGTLKRLWQHPSPPLDLLQALKFDAKSEGKRAQRNPDSSPLPSVLNAVLYTAVIAAARVKLGCRITRDSDLEFVPRLQFLLGQKWLDPATREMLDAWNRTIVGGE